MPKKQVQRKKFTGEVVSTSMDKTAVVSLERSKMHPLYKKRYYFDKKIKAHDPKNKTKLGDKVEITETNPISKDKKYIVSKIIKE